MSDILPAVRRAPYELPAAPDTVAVIPSPVGVEVAALTDPIPEIKRRYREDGQFYYVDIEYTIERLNMAYGPGNWSFVPLNVRTFEGITAKGDPKTEVMVEGRLYAAGAISTGIVGVGSGTFFEKSDRATYSNAYATAISEATKNAAKKLGIGLDIKDRDAQKLEQAQGTLKTLVETMAVNGKRARVLEVLAATVPQAMSGEEFQYWLVDENQIDAVKRAVLNVAREK